MIAVALYAEDAVARRRLEALCHGDGLAVVGTADTAPQLDRLLAEAEPDVVIAYAPHAGAWRSALGRTPLVAFIDADADEAARDLLRAGARALLPRTVGKAEVVAALTAAAAGYALLPQRLLDALIAEQRPEPDPDADALLTRRELEVLQALAAGASNKVIARRLGISFHTVKFHVAAILEKLDADTRTEAVAQAARLGLVML
jgi:DNA-binding NarL/FixJ family response regulator